MTITSPHNEKLKLIRRLAERRARDREGLFVVEGEDLVESALTRGMEAEFLLSVPGYDGPGADRAIEVDPDLLDAVSALGSGSRVIGVWTQRWSEAAGPVCVYLDGVADPGNVGAAIRSVGALVDGTVAIGAKTADPYSPKAVRAAMGAVFARPPARPSIEETPRPRIGLVAHGGSWPVALTAPVGGDGTPHGSPAELPGPLPPPPLTLCFGGERHGLSDRVLSACDATATIPLPNEAVESLNVAAAVAICCERVSSLAVPTSPASSTLGEGAR